MSTKGFSLIEMLVVIVLFALLAFIVTQSTLQSFKGVSKADASSKVKDNLSFAASVFERNVRNAKAILSNCDSVPRSAINYIDTSGQTQTIQCLGPSTNMYLSGVQGRITSSEVALTTCQITCRTVSSISPPSVDIILSGSAAGASSIDGTLTTVTRTVTLRVY